MTAPDKAIRLPELDTYLANAALRCLRQWKQDNDTPHPRPWYVTDEDLHQLEEWIADLRRSHQETSLAFERDGFTVISQPSRVYSHGRDGGK